MDENEFYLWFNGKLILKKWLDSGYSMVFDHHAWGRYTEKSITDFDLKETPPLYSVECKFTLFSKEDGGRETPIANGYRPNHVFEYEENGNPNYVFIGDFQFGKNNTIAPGETNYVLARFLTTQPIEQYFNIGQKWWVQEGPMKIGEAEILKIELPVEN